MCLPPASTRSRLPGILALALMTGAQYRYAQPNAPTLRMPFRAGTVVLCQQGNLSPAGWTHSYSNALHAVDFSCPEDVLLQRITLDPGVCHGKPCLRGLRYPVESVLGWLSAGMSTEEILADYPDLEREDVLAALLYAARLTQVKQVYRTA